MQTVFKLCSNLKFPSVTQELHYPDHLVRDPDLAHSATDSEMKSLCDYRVLPDIKCTEIES